MSQKILILGLSLFTLIACEGYFGDTNENPNRPIDVTVDVILPAVQVEIAQIYGGEFSRYASILTQHAQGVARA